MAQRSMTFESLPREITAAWALREIRLGDDRILFDPAFFDPAFFQTTGRGGWITRRITTAMQRRAVTFSDWSPL